MSGPALSVCVVTGRYRRRTERCVASLLSQEVEGGLEVLVVDVSAEGLEFAQRGDGRVRHLRMAGAGTYSAPRTLALDEARAPYVAYVEDHALVEEGWAREVLRAFEDERNDVVVYGFGNANPKNWVSELFLLMAYGRWMRPAEAGELAFGPGNNVAYRRRALLALRDRLPALLDTEMLLQRALVEGGGRIWHAPEARALHENWLGLRGCDMDLRICCRQFAAHRIRVEGMSWGRRLVYAGGMALMPFLHVWRLGKNLRRSPVLWRQWARFAPVMLLLYIPASMAEGAGYLFGAGDADQRRLEVEVFARRDMD